MIKRFRESGTAADKERLGRPRTAHVKMVFNALLSMCSTDVNKGAFCTVGTLYWIITLYHESFGTSSIQNSTDTGVTNDRLSETVDLARDFLQLTSDYFILLLIMLGSRIVD